MDSTLTPAQGRVLFHLGRLFRSTGAGTREHLAYIADKAIVALPAAVDTWTDEQCAEALRAMERCARPMALFRDVRTYWESLLPRERCARGEKGAP